MKKLIIAIYILTSISFAQSSSKYFIYFKDKGINNSSSLQKNSFQYKQAIKSISERSINRRIKTLGQDFITFEDLPLNTNYISKIENSGAKIIWKLKWLNAVSAILTNEQYQQISKYNFISKVEKVKKLKYKNDKSVESQLEKTTNIVNSDYKHDYGQSLTQYELSDIPIVHDYGFSGQGVLIGILDAGFAWRDHPSLVNKNVIAERDFVNGDKNLDDGDASHGTAVFSLIGGFEEGKIVGPAFNAKYVLAKTEYIYTETNLEEDNYAAGLEWMDSIGVDITTTSLGYTEFDTGEKSYSYSDMDGKTTVVTKASELAFARGITTINSAGNEGNSSWKYISAPADGFNTISVGAVTSDTVLASFSSIGPTYDGRIKPEIVAQGVACYHANAYSSNYGYGSGTSYSAPIAAGIAAQLLSAFPHLTNSQIRLILIQASNRVNNPDNQYGYGLLSAKKAIEFPNVEFTQNSNSFSINKIVIDSSGILDDNLEMFYSINNGNEFSKLISTSSEKGYFQYEISTNPNDLIKFYFKYKDSNLVSKRIPESATYELASGNSEITLNYKIPVYSFDIGLSQNFPNPFNSTTSIIVTAPKGTNILVEVHNILGQKISTIFKGNVSQETTLIYWNGLNSSNSRVSSGIYFCKATTKDGIISKKMVYVK
ncbi:MAG: S8 family serine peptidase [Bacteroidetes bacterium]|nr:S8 family serine peptidase [Bacteroidota bacterium]MBU1116126.1 S8 family serine peptidase [Bacteroidota bacterium]MBU1800418.1 S8 family serine peptidase [Bacteroidota bacterium]